MNAADRIGHRPTVPQETVMTNEARGESIVGLARELVRGAIELVRMEVTSARQELGEGMSRLGGGAILLVIGLVFALLMLVALVVLVVGIVAIWLPLWFSALIVMLAFLALGALFGYLGVRRMLAARERLMLPETRASVQEDMAWAKRLLRRDEK
jgi:uncharacterized membrane protein YqjE